MVWIRIDDQIAHHPKFMAAGPIASWLWVCGNGYCNKYLTDGFIRSSALKTLGGVTNAAKWAERLADVGLWDRVEGGYLVHDFHDHNPTAAEVKEKRRKDRDRKRRATDFPSGADEDSTRNPDASRARVPTETVSEPDPTLPKKNGAQAGHRRHAFCGIRFCVPSFLHDEFANQLGERGLAKFDLLAWYPTLDRRDDYPIPGDVLGWVRREFSTETRRLFVDPARARATAMGVR